MNKKASTEYQNKGRIRMKRLFIILSTIFLATGLVACVNDDLETQAKEETNDTIETDDNNEIGSHANPVPLEENIQLDDIILDLKGDDLEEYEIKVEISISEVIQGKKAHDILKKENEFNEEAPKGFEWVLVKAKGKVVESETEEVTYPFYDSNFQFVSNDGKAYDEELSAVTPNNLFEELKVGEEAEGYISGVVKTGDHFLIQYETMGDKEVYFQVK